MKMNDHGHEILLPERGAVEGLTLQIEEVLFSKESELSPGEILTALMIAIGGELAAIECRDCRKQAARNVKKLISSVVALALTAPSELEPTTTRCAPPRKWGGRYFFEE